MDSGLELRQVEIRYNDDVLLRVSQSVAPGEVLSLMGPSGSGKSTLLAFVSGTLSPEFSYAGEIWLNGSNITELPPHLRRIGILFQDDLLFPHMSVGQNLAFGLSPGGTAESRRKAVSEALGEVGLAGYENRDPDTLSGGQKARVSLMRMLLSEPRALLLDEPFSRLDEELRDRTRSMVFELAKRRKLPVLLVTHDMEDARQSGGMIVNLSQ